MLAAQSENWAVGSTRLWGGGGVRKQGIDMHSRAGDITERPSVVEGRLQGHSNLQQRVCGQSSKAFVS